MIYRIKNKRLFNGPLDINYDVKQTLNFKLEETLSSLEGLYCAGGLSPAMPSDRLLWLSFDASLSGNVLSFSIDTYTENFLQIDELMTRAYIEIGQINNDVREVILQDDIIVQPRVYVEGLQPTPISTRFATEDWVNLHFQPIIDENNKLDYSLLSGDVPIGGGGISSIVRPNGTAFTNTDNKVTISYAGTSAGAAGIVFVNSSYGILASNGQLRINCATDSQIAAKTNTYAPIVPGHVNFAVGDALSGTNHIIFTDAGLSAAQATLGIDKKQDIISISSQLDASLLSGSIPSSLIPVNDVQLPNTGNTYDSCVTNGIAKLPVGSTTKTGVFAAHWLMGFQTNGKYLRIYKAPLANISSRGTTTAANTCEENAPIVPNNLNAAVSAALSDPRHIVFTNDGLLSAQATLGIDKKQDIISLDNQLDYSLLSGTPFIPTNYISGVTLVNAGLTVTNHNVTIPAATTTKWGACRPATAYGTNQDANRLYLVKATDAEIVDRTQLYKPIVPNNLNFAVSDALTGTNKINFPDNSLSGLKDAIGATGEIPGSGIITLTQGGVTKGSFNVNQTSDQTIDLDAGGGGSEGLLDQIYTTDAVLTALHDKAYFWDLQNKDATLYIEDIPNKSFEIPIDINLSGSTVTLSGITRVSVFADGYLHRCLLTKQYDKTYLYIYRIEAGVTI